MVNPVKLATPFTALLVKVPERVPDPGFVPVTSVIEADESVFRFPFES